MPTFVMRRNQKIVAVFLWLVFWASGCQSKNTNLKAKKYASLSEHYYRLAVASYQAAMGKGVDLDNLHFELGLLYYSHGSFKEAVAEFKKTLRKEARKFLGISYYRLGEFSEALDVFSKSDSVFDDEYRYYWGLTCEKLNLFDQALRVYSQIKTKEFSPLALQRREAIEKTLGLLNIQDIDPQIAKIIAEAPEQQRYPQAGGLILYCDEKIEVTEENKEIDYLHYVVKILNERGKENFSEAVISYDSTFEKVELVYARTIKPDGSVVDVGLKHIRDVSKYLNFPLYSNVRAFIISFPEVCEGAVVEYKLKKYNNHLINMRDLVISYPLQTTDPILEAKFTITIPDDRQLNLNIRNIQSNNFAASLEPRIEKEKGRVSYYWQFSDIPQIIPESLMPPINEITPTILVSTFQGWDAIYKWWWSLAKGKIRPDTTIKDKVQQLTASLTGDEDKARAIYNFCAQKIRYVAVEYGQAGYEPHQAVDIFKNKYGDCKDQAILLVTMLKEAGLSAWPVLIPTKDYYNAEKEFPAVLFNHCIAAVSLSGRLYFLDPTCETCAFGDLPAADQNRTVLVCKEDGFELANTPLYPAEKNNIIQDLKIKINTDETILGIKTVTTSGFYDQGQRFWLLYSPPELIEQTIKEKIQDISIGAGLKEYQIDNLDNLGKPTVLCYTFFGPEFLTAAGNLRVLPQLARIDTTVTAKEKRRFAIDYGVLSTHKEIIEIELPPQFKVRYLPDSITDDNPWFKFTVAYIQKNNTIIYKEEMLAKRDRVELKDYPVFKQLLESLAKRVKQRIILEER